MVQTKLIKDHTEEREKNRTESMDVYDVRCSESKALPVALFVNAAHDIKP